MSFHTISADRSYFLCSAKMILPARSNHQRICYPSTYNTIFDFPYFFLIFILPQYKPVLSNGIIKPGNPSENPFSWHIPWRRYRRQIGNYLSYGIHRKIDLTQELILTNSLCKQYRHLQRNFLFYWTPFYEHTFMWIGLQGLWTRVRRKL